MANDLRRMRDKVLPRDLKKSSTTRRAHAQNPIKVAGQRELTETGYTVEGYCGKAFETFFEVMLPGTASAFYLHDKKDKSIWIIGGQGFVTTDSPTTGQQTRRVISGDTVAFERGVTYRLATTANMQLEFFVTQAAKYGVALQVVVPSDATKAASAADLVEPTLRERLGQATTVPTERRGRSKAAQQQARKHRRSAQVEDKFSIVPAAIAPDPRGTGSSVAGMNAAPSLGKFDDAGAG